MWLWCTCSWQSKYRGDAKNNHINRDICYHDNCKLCKECIISLFNNLKRKAWILQNEYAIYLSLQGPQEQNSIAFHDRPGQSNWFICFKLQWDERRAVIGHYTDGVLICVILPYPYIVVFESVIDKDTTAAGHHYVQQYSHKLQHPSLVFTNKCWCCSSWCKRIPWGSDKAKWDMAPVLLGYFGNIQIRPWYPNLSMSWQSQKSDVT